MRCSGSSAVSMVVSGSFIFAGCGAAPARAQITPSTSISWISVVGDIWGWNCNGACETLSSDCTCDSPAPPLSLTVALLLLLLLKLVFIPRIGRRKALCQRQQRRWQRVNQQRLFDALPLCNKCKNSHNNNKAQQ